MKNLLIAIILINAYPLVSQELKMSLHAGISFLQQQVKEEIGGENFPKLFNYSEVNLNFDMQYSFNEYLSAGTYFRYDFGNRQHSQITDQENLTVEQISGSDYSEYWIGPLITGHYKQVFITAGYGLLAARNDEFLTITNSENELTPQNISSFAYMFRIGGEFELSQKLHFIVMLEYRARYYDMINDKDISHGNDLGTQSFSPLAGICYRFDI